MRVNSEARIITEKLKCGVQEADVCMAAGKSPKIKYKIIKSEKKFLQRIICKSNILFDWFLELVIAFKPIN